MSDILWVPITFCLSLSVSSYHIFSNPTNFDTADTAKAVWPQHDIKGVLPRSSIDASQSFTQQPNSARVQSHPIPSWHGTKNTRPVKYRLLPTPNTGPILFRCPCLSYVKPALSDHVVPLEWYVVAMTSRLYRLPFRYDSTCRIRPNYYCHHHYTVFSWVDISLVKEFLTLIYRLLHRRCYVSEVWPYITLARFYIWYFTPFI